jgi:hypothetical protein
VNFMTPSGHAQAEGLKTSSDHAQAES